MIQDNEKLVRAFYEATAPGHRARLRALQSPHVVYDMPEGMPIGAGHFGGMSSRSGGSKEPRERLASRST